MVLARFRTPVLAVTIGAAAAALALLSLAVPAQAAAGGNVGGRGYTIVRPGAPSVMNNTDFAGYVAAVAPGSATSAAAHFKVPRLSCTAAPDRGITPGVLVFVNSFRTASAASVFAICHRGRALYFPALLINGHEVNYITTPVHAGDVIKVSATVTTRGTTVQVTDVTTRVTKRRTGAGARSSAAFVGDGSVFLNTTRLGVPNFGTLTFTSCLVNGRALARSHHVRIQRVNSRGILQIATGALSPRGTAFATLYRHF
jgi:hypothetical protein